jgi:hypothetical protein
MADASSLRSCLFGLDVLIDVLKNAANHKAGRCIEAEKE